MWNRGEPAQPPVCTKSGRLWLLLAGLLMVSVLTQCQPAEEEKENDRLLVKVYNKSLYLSDMDGMFPEGTTNGDSTAIINAYVERWIREALLLHEAERNIPSDLNIDKLVRDYRASLIRHNYERILVEQLLDSMVTQTELTAFYENNKEQYQLETPIVRCYFVKAPLPVPEPAELRRLWNSNEPEDYEALVNYCNKYATAHLLEDSTWYNVEDLALNMPKGAITVNNIGSIKDFSQRDDQFQYYFKVFELKNIKEIAPLSYIEDQARKVILHRRKLKLLEDQKEEMYELEMRRNNIKLYTD
jgi:SHS2 domain-containing protein